MWTCKWCWVQFQRGLQGGGLEPTFVTSALCLWHVMWIFPEIPSYSPLHLFPVALKFSSLFKTQTWPCCIHTVVPVGRCLHPSAPALFPPKQFPSSILDFCLLSSVSTHGNTDSVKGASVVFPVVSPSSEL